MFMKSLLLAMSVALAAGDTPEDSAGVNDPILDKCEIVSIEDQDVPGSEAGVLASLEAKEGMLVTKDMVIGKIDTREAEAIRMIKEYDYKVAAQKAKSNVEIRVAEKASAVSQKAYEMNLEANKASKNTVTKLELMKLKLEWEKADLTVEKYQEDNIEAKLTAQAKQAELNAADIAISRRTLRAPFDGVVVKVYRHPGEWVAPGEPVVRIVRVDRLRVHGNLDARKYGPGDVDGRRVDVEVTLPRGRSVTVPGKVVFVSPVVGVGQKLPVFVEIDCPMENDVPVVRAGLEARMTIHVKEPAAEVRPASLPRKPEKKG